MASLEQLSLILFNKNYNWLLTGSPNLPLEYFPKVVKLNITSISFKHNMNIKDRRSQCQFLRKQDIILSSKHTFKYQKFATF